MDPLWSEFRSAPGAYLSARKSNMETFVHDLLQVLQNDDRSENSKLAILGLFQEMAPLLFSESARLESAISVLKTVFHQQRNSGSALICSQVLCTLTTLLIEMEEFLKSHDQILLEFIGVLFDVVEKVKTDFNRLLKAMACECLRELEMAFPGLLTMKIGHFFAMSQAENSHIHQNYMVLFATVLENTIHKFLQDHGGESSLEHSLTDLLSYSEPLKSFTLAEGWRDQATRLLTKLHTGSVEEGSGVHEMKKGVSFLLDHHHLMTPACLCQVALKMISCVQCSALSPKMLKSLLLQYSSCQDLRLFHIVLMLKMQFAEDICDEGDDETLKRWLVVMASHPSLPTYQKAVLLQWLLYWPEEKEPGEVKEGDDEIEPQLDGREYAPLLPAVFDPLHILCHKLKVLSCQHQYWETSDEHSPPALKDLLGHVLKLVDYGISGTPAVTVYRTLFTYYLAMQHSPIGAEITRLVLDVLMRQPKFIPHTIEFLNSIERHCPDSPLPLMVLADYSQQLASSKLPVLLAHLPLHLLFLRQAAAHTQIQPLVMLQIMSRALRESSLCSAGLWEVGTALLDVCNTIMRRHQTEAIFKDLVDLLQLISREYNDVDIQDRARFYHQLLLTVSGGKLSAILTLASDSATGSSLSDIVEARISDSVFPSAPPVQQIAESFLHLARMEWTCDSSYSEFQTKSGSALDDKTALKSYLDAIGGDASPVAVKLQYKIHFEKKPESVSQRIYALVLKFSTEGPYHPSPDVYVPYMVAAENGTSPASASVVVLSTFYPKEPVPASFDVSAVFTTEEGLTCTTQLSTVKIAFEDIFQPVAMIHFEKISPVQLFSLLWKNIEENKQPQCGILSTMHIELGRQGWEQHLRKLQGFCVASDNEVKRLLIFLPPRYHLLLKIHVEENSVVIATDNWKMLPLINTFLDQLRNGNVAT